MKRSSKYMQYRQVIYVMQMTLGRWMKIFRIVLCVSWRANPHDIRFSHIFSLRESRSCYGTFIVCVLHHWSLMCFRAGICFLLGQGNWCSLFRKRWLSYFTITVRLIKKLREMSKKLLMKNIYIVATFYSKMDDLFY